MKKHYFYLLLLIGLWHDASYVRASSCTERGRFPNDENYDCRGYVMCLIGGITNFTQYKLNCPQGSIYSHLEQQCTNSTNYKCYPSFNCTIVSNFENPESEDCSSYISCIQGIDNIATARLIQCPVDTMFNATVGECVDTNLTMCYNSLVKPVTRHPLEKTSNNYPVNVHNHKKPETEVNGSIRNHIIHMWLIFGPVFVIMFWN